MCSSGRWYLDGRGPPILQEVNKALDHVVVSWSLAVAVRGGALNGFTPCTGPGACWRKSCHTGSLCYETAPWAGIGVLTAVKKAEGVPGIDWSVPAGQPYRARAIARLLQLCGDPDGQWFQAMAEEGVDTGLDEPLPRNPLISRLKEKWRLKEWQGE